MGESRKDLMTGLIVGMTVLTTAVHVPHLTVDAGDEPPWLARLNVVAADDHTHRDLTGFVAFEGRAVADATSWAVSVSIDPVDRAFLVNLIGEKRGDVTSA
jgi:hypothetical protein